MKKVSWHYGKNIFFKKIHSRYLGIKYYIPTTLNSVENLLSKVNQ